ncbi:adenylyl-sulfate kinase [Vibrio vulnificus]|uniref:Adenylyl-sulfate kinase n=1 Tax=Vibrio vulnificus TaxID=672 RepID=A0A2S3R5X7_VIBVL|nr:adenylyl-sulfate kinase [Vibrio vulnificus]EGR1510445.1 adenylyl-sulfate kinase [Vibrio vulnificus]EHH0749932.1 adenylyl-sulfate kinase [Vibrio vulnificus]EHT4940773.1 adenylyl-sulfate kinase [Vibrio vulnificus]EJB8415285.1 adenylyl-sulfate kinase [Vibrio vulnificus]ELP6757164.1 adenylyl-sulfate kinase [Vibrio vulnificus]
MKVYEVKKNNSVSDDLVWHHSSVTHQERVRQKGQRPVVLWFTGLSGSGKSTIANALERRLLELNKHSYLLDGDNVRHGLNQDLGFNESDRVENIRRVAEVAHLFVDAGMIVLTAFISPFRRDRKLAKEKIGPDAFIEIYLDIPLTTCEQRDPKGLYKKARQGLLKNFTGIDSDYEAPLAPDIVIQSDMSIESAVDTIIAVLSKKAFI